MSQPLSKFLCLTITKKFVGNTSVLCFRKFPVAKKFLDKKGGGGVSRFCGGIFLCHGAEKFHG